MKFWIPLLLAAAAVLPSAASDGLSARDLAARLAEGERVALLDIRSNGEFSANHIPGAMNMPARVLDARRLPSSRPLVVYGDGLGRHDARAVAESLRAEGRDNIEWLRGGLAAWESAGRATTKAAGFDTDSVPGITYNNLVRSGGRDMVVMDIRTPQAAPAPEPGTFGVASDGPALTDLGSLVPQARVVRPADGAGEDGTGFAPQADGGGAGVPRVQPDEDLIVIVDDGDGSGEDLARSLRAAGNRRVVVLTGGETILRREGRPGLERQGMGAQEVEGPPEEGGNE